MIQAPLPSAGTPGASTGRVLAAVLALLLGGTVYGLARHAGFQATYLVRAVAPILALLFGAAFTHRLAKSRQHLDVPGEFNPAGRALFLGAAMLAATLLSWVVLALALPAAVTAAIGTPRTEPGIVAQRIPLAPGPECRYRLEVTSATVLQPMDECVVEAQWNQAAAGDPLHIDLVSSVLGAEVVGVRP